MELVFRVAKPSDKKRIEKLLILLKHDYVPMFSEEEMREGLEKIHTSEAEAILALTKTNQIAGYIMWEPYPRNKKYGYIVNLGVHPTYRGKGISIKLRKMVFNKIKRAGFKGVYYTTWHKNKAMIESSKKLGMKVVSIYLHEKYRGPGGKTILFRKEFT